MDFYEKVFEFLRPLLGRDGGLHDSRFRAHHNVLPTLKPQIFIFCYSLFHKKGTFSVHSFNNDYLSIPDRPGS